MSDKVIAVIGLGYVGLPIAVEFGKSRRVIGFDVSERRIADLRNGHDQTLEVEPEELAEAKLLEFSTNPKDLEQAQIYIVAVQTPVDDAKRPDTRSLVKASEMIGGVLKKGDIVIYESTVYPGCTEEVCVPALERASGMTFNQDFFCGYSPERVSPGDKARRMTQIVKVTSGSTPEIADEVDDLYASIVTAGTHKAPNLKVAEAAKVIENTQRDLNIALMNELAFIFERIGIDTGEVLAAAGTKWNFLPFRPGLVGGHCIGVDPYYLTHKAQEVGYDPQLILEGRMVNDRVGQKIAERVTKMVLARNGQVAGGKVLIMGFTFKEDCPDIRNSRIIDIVSGLKEYSFDVDIHDPWANSQEVQEEFGLDCKAEAPAKGQYDAIIVAVGHELFKDMGASGIREFGKPNAVLFDTKSIFAIGESDGRL